MKRLVRRFFWSSTLLLIMSLLIPGHFQAQEESVFSKRSKVDFSGMLQSQFHTTSVEGYIPMNSFLIRRARLKATFKNPDETLEGKVEMDAAEGKVVLQDGYVDLKVNDRMKIKMGQYKKPFSLWELTSDTENMVIERANRIMGSENSYSTNNVIVKDGGYASRDIGVQVHGTAGKVDYAVGAFNGNGSHVAGDNESGKTIGGRLVVDVREDLAIGAAVSNRMINDYQTISGNDTTVSDENFQAFEVDLDHGIGAKVEKTGPWIQAEFFFGKNPAFHSTDVNFMGFMAAASYNFPTEENGLIRSVRPAFRFDLSQRDTDDDDTQTILITPGLDIFFDKYNRLAINLDVNMPKAEGLDTELGFRTQFQMII